MLTEGLPSGGASIAKSPWRTPPPFPAHSSPSTKLAKLIRWYIDSFEHISKWQRSKQAQLLFLEKHPIGEADAMFLEAATLVDHIRSRRAKGADQLQSPTI